MSPRNRIYYERSRHNPRKRVRTKPPSAYILESGTTAQIAANAQYSEDLSKYYWDLYSAFAGERSKVQEVLETCLTTNCIEKYVFTHWQRVVRYKYSLDPLVSVGSLSNGGGRFNIGDIDRSRYPMFPALYLAERRETALQEVFTEDVNADRLTRLDFALTRTDSIAVVSVSGEVENVLDLRTDEPLKAFARTISGFKIPESLRREARRLGQADPESVTRHDQLWFTLMDPNWRVFPSVVDVPANSQILGQIAHSAQIGGVLYPSKFDGCSCLAIYPENIRDTTTFLQLEDTVPNVSMIVRLDNGNWQESLTQRDPKRSIYANSSQ